MEKIPAIAILDIGKTNKKLLIFDPDYRILYEHSEKIEETADEDGFPCEDLVGLNRWMDEAFHIARQQTGVEIKALNFSAYGASLVHIGKSGKAWGPLYNYLKPFREEWRREFVQRHLSIDRIAMETASPDLGSLNAGMQLFRLAAYNPDFQRYVLYSLHLPQYLCWYFSGRSVSEITSVGCHTMMWDFKRNEYHNWLIKEKLTSYLAPVHKAERPVTPLKQQTGIIYGTGLHDSSAALIPYIRMGGERFVIISTGTWSISLNPFNHEPLTDQELASDCLSYLSHQGNPIKASRYFIGPAHDLVLKRVNDHFNRTPDLSTLKFNRQWFDLDQQIVEPAQCDTPEEAYHRLMTTIMIDQKKSLDLCIGSGNIQKICVDGGFSRNEIYLQMLAQLYPHCDVYAAAVHQASAVGAAMILEGAWNPDPPAIGLVELRFIPRLRGL